MVTNLRHPTSQGHYLDTLARKFLWDVGLDYLHGTGHGIGSYLNVHEGPMGVSWRTYPDDPGLSEGMFLSNGECSSLTLRHITNFVFVVIHLFVFFYALCRTWLL